MNGNSIEHWSLYFILSPVTMAKKWDFQKHGILLSRLC